MANVNPIIDPTAYWRSPSRHIPAEDAYFNALEMSHDFNTPRGA
jgi:hypothetical protein